MGSHDWGIVILTLFALFVASGCSFEYFRIAELQGHHPIKPLGYFFTACMVVGVGVLPLNGPMEVAGGIITLVLGSILFLSLPTTLIVELWRNSEHPFGDVLHTLLPTVWCALPLGLMTLLHYEFNILMMCVIMVWVNDCFAYMGGSVVGKHKMWTRHSPGKTWEGTAIGVVACALTGIFVGPLFNTDLSQGAAMEEAAENAEGAADVPLAEENASGGEVTGIEGFMVFDSSGTLRYDARVIAGQVLDAYGSPIDGCYVNENGYVVDAYMNVIDPMTGTLAAQ